MIFLRHESVALLNNGYPALFATFAYHIWITKYVYLKRSTSRDAAWEALQFCIGQLILQLHFFVFKIEKVLSEQISTLRKWWFFLKKDEFTFLLISSFFSLDIVYSKRSITNPQTTSWKAIHFTHESLMYSYTVCFKNGQNSERINFIAAKRSNTFSFLFTSSYVLFKQIKYTERCSVKSSTIYQEHFILYLHFWCSKKAKFCATSYHSVEIYSLGTLSILDTKNYNFKIGCRM